MNVSRRRFLKHISAAAVGVGTVGFGLDSLRLDEGLLPEARATLAPDMEETNYIVYLSSGNVCARNGTTGNLDYSNAGDATPVLQSVADALTNGGTILVRAGTYSMSAAVLLSNPYTHIILDSAATLTLSRAAPVQNSTPPYYPPYLLTLGANNCTVQGGNMNGNNLVTVDDYLAAVGLVGAKSFLVNGVQRSVVGARSCGIFRVSSMNIDGFGAAFGANAGGLQVPTSDPTYTFAAPETYSYFEELTAVNPLTHGLNTSSPPPNGNTFPTTVCGMRFRHCMINCAGLNYQQSTDKYVAAIGVGLDGDSQDIVVDDCAVYGNGNPPSTYQGKQTLGADGMNFEQYTSSDGIYAPKNCKFVRCFINGARISFAGSSSSGQSPLVANCEVLDCQVRFDVNTYDAAAILVENTVKCSIRGGWVVNAATGATYTIRTNEGTNASLVIDGVRGNLPPCDLSG